MRTHRETYFGFTTYLEFKPVFSDDCRSLSIFICRFCCNGLQARTGDSLDRPSIVEISVQVRYIQSPYFPINVSPKCIVIARWSPPLACYHLPVPRFHLIQSSPSLSHFRYSTFYYNSMWLVDDGGRGREFQQEPQSSALSLPLWALIEFVMV